MHAATLDSIRMRGLSDNPAGPVLRGRDVFKTDRMAKIAASQRLAYYMKPASVTARMIAKWNANKAAGKATGGAPPVGTPAGPLAAAMRASQGSTRHCAHGMLSLMQPCGLVPHAEVLVC